MAAGVKDEDVRVFPLEGDVVIGDERIRTVLAWDAFPADVQQAIVKAQVAGAFEELRKAYGAMIAFLKTEANRVQTLAAKMLGSVMPDDGEEHPSEENDEFIEEDPDDDPA